MLVAHLSDLHVTDPTAPVAAFANGAVALAAAVEHLNGLDAPVDAVIVTGDLVNDGTVEEYHQLRDLLEPLDAPAYLVVGNHDEPDALRSVFPDHTYLPEAGPSHWVVDDHEVRLVAIDTTKAGHHEGALDRTEIDWLDGVLADAPERPTLVAMHHPPVLTGMWWMDYGGLDTADELRSVVACHPQVKAVLAGHVHRPFHLSWGSTLVCTAPALTYQSCLALADTSPPLVADVAAPIPLLWWTEGELLAVHTDYRVPQRTLDLRDVIPDWDDYEARCRAGGPLPKDLHG